MAGQRKSKKLGELYLMHKGLFKLIRELVESFNHNETLGKLGTICLSQLSLCLSRLALFTPFFLPFSAKTKRTRRRKKERKKKKKERKKKKKGGRRRRKKEETMEACKKSEMVCLFLKFSLFLHV